MPPKKKVAKEVKKEDNEDSDFGDNISDEDSEIEDSDLSEIDAEDVDMNHSDSEDSESEYETESAKSDTEYDSEDILDDVSEPETDAPKCMYSYDAPMSEYEPLPEPRRIPDDERITEPVLTNYETSRLLGARAKQLSENAKSLVSNIDDYIPLEIAYYELINGKLPIKIKRPMPDNTYEIWKSSEMRIKKGFNPLQSIKKMKR
jgi:DNA-directed RNA polymerase subunit K/omega